MQNSMFGLSSTAIYDGGGGRENAAFNTFGSTATQTQLQQ